MRAVKIVSSYVVLKTCDRRVEKDDILSNEQSDT